jgi:transcriptional regulator with XRE-family HTH domain
MTTNRVREHRRAALLSAAELGALVGVSGSAITAIERGTRRPGFKTERRIAVALDTPPSILFPAAAGA